MHEIYKIEGAINIQFDGRNFLDDPNFFPEFQSRLEEFKKLVVNLEKEGKSASFIHFGDGDYFFLQKKAVGSATPGKRALSIPYDRFDITPFREGFLKNDYYCVEYLEPGMRDKLNELYQSIQTIPTEFLYGLTMNRWFMKNFKGKIGLIGAKEKLDIIRELLKRKEYQEYLGLDKFEDYIEIPQRFACDDIEKTVYMVSEQLKNSTSTVFLFGVGHVKSGLIHRLKNVKNAIYLDVGAGIDGIAGLIDPERPYANSWVNFRMKNYNYGNVDLLQYNKNLDKNLKYIE